MHYATIAALVVIATTVTCPSITTRSANILLRLSTTVGITAALAFMIFSLNSNFKVPFKLVCEKS